jgi:hypothetical protein
MLNKKVLHIITLTIGLGLAIIAHAATTDTSQAPKTTATTNTVTCPPIKDIKKDTDTMTWKDSENRFKSYNKSFANTLKSFLGAQWAGTNVGQVTCVYKGKEVGTFPILLIFNTLALSPQGGQWSNDKEGLSNCASNDPNDCPFKTRVEPKTEDIYKEAEQLKSGDTNAMDSEPGY